MAEISDELAENYRQLAKERGTTLAQLAAETEPTDRALAAWMRSESTPERTQPPKNRRGAKVDKAAGPDSEE